jgi:hypothetical protein
MIFMKLGNWGFIEGGVLVMGLIEYWRQFELKIGEFVRTNEQS